MANSDFDQTQAARFAALALDCVHKPYPNKIAHSLNSDLDVKPPRELNAGVLRLLRLAFLGPRALAAGPPGAAVSTSSVRG
jgi:hypothetical protein